MKHKRHKSNDIFSGMQRSATGMVGLSLATAVGANIAAKAPAGTPSMTEGFNTLSSFTPIAVTATMGKSILKLTKKKY